MQLRLAPRARKPLIRCALAIVLLAAGCRGPTAIPELRIAMETSPKPPRAGSTQFVLELTDVDNRPVTGARIELEGDMSHPGMAPIFGTAREIAAGRYASQLRLTMAGDWVILLHITLSGGRKLEREMPLPGVRN